jgi:flavin reductase (DIM6/NTAB) family NADH-FMN oxidoreductase RutF
MIVDPKKYKPSEFHAYMLGAVAPRPIAFASTVDKEGNPNLSPFSFFNAFGSNPPLLIFSPALSGRTGATKHTLDNIREVDEVVINVVSYSMVQQASLASSEYAKGINEFVKAGFTPIASDLVKPFRVKESPVQMECKVQQIIQTGVRGGAANLVLCEILLMHINDDVLDESQKIDPMKIDQVARMGGSWYTRAAKGLFEVPKPLAAAGMGIDLLPAAVKNSKILSGNDLGLLGNVHQLPTEDDIRLYSEREDVKKLTDALKANPSGRETVLHLAAKQLLTEGKVQEALMLLISTNR